MSQRRKWGGLVLAAVATVVLIAVAVPDAKAYRGRTLIQWLQPTLIERQSYEGLRSYQTNSVLAFEEAGRSGVELLLHEIAARDNSWNWRLFAAFDYLYQHLYQRKWLSGTRPGFSQSPQERVFWPASILSGLRAPSACIPLLTDHFADAEKAIVTLGDRAPSVRVSNQTARDTLEIRFRATATALANSGPTGVGVVANALARTTDTDRAVTLIGALHQAGTNAVPAVPVLLALTSRTKAKEADKALESRPVPPGVPWAFASSFYGLVLHALIDIRGDAALPFLLQAATNRHVGAVAALGEYGPTAAHLLPHILPLTTNADPSVSFQAEIAVRKIRGEPQ
jgi:hypothetical protein